MLASFCIFSLGRGKKEEPDPVFVSLSRPVRRLQPAMPGAQV